MSGSIRIPTVAELQAKRAEKKKPDEEQLPQKAVDETLNALTIFSDDILPTEVSGMIKTLNAKGVDNEKIALALRKLLNAKKLIVIGTGQFASSQEVPDNPIILATIKFIATLRNVIPARETKIKGQMDHSFSNIPKGSAGRLKARLKAVQEAKDVEFEVVPDVPIN
jgi:hypothetical protein